MGNTKSYESNDIQPVKVFLFLRMKQDRAVNNIIEKKFSKCPFQYFEIRTYFALSIEHCVQLTIHRDKKKKAYPNLNIENIGKNK